MRVIAGSARGRRLHPPSGSRVRPTSDRVKEALFSTLTSRFGTLEDLVVLDLFAGAGGLGIEALSRGCAVAYFVDSHRDSIALIRKNLAATGLTGQSIIIEGDALKAIRHLAAHKVFFDIILIDPPYAETALTGDALKLITDMELLSAGGLLAVETDNRCQLQFPEQTVLSARKVYGDTALWLLEQQ